MKDKIIFKDGRAKICMQKRSLIVLLIIGLFVFSLSFAAAQKITGSLQGARMVLSAAPGEKVERSILVSNRNEVSIMIGLKPSGDLADNLEIKGEANFSLDPGEERKVYFTIEADEPGTTETKINVLFTPEEGNGVGLPAVIILVASGEASEIEEIVEDESGFSFNPSGNAVSDFDSEGGSVSPIAIALISTAVLAIVFVALVLYSRKKRGARRARGV